MKQFIKKLKHIVKRITQVIVLLVIVTVAAYGIYAYVTKDSKKVVEVFVADEQSDYEKRVDQMVIDTQDDWNQKHRVWAEQQISQEIIAEQEAKLIELRKQEVSL